MFKNKFVAFKKTYNVKICSCNLQKMFRTIQKSFMNLKKFFEFEKVVAYKKERKREEKMAEDNKLIKWADPLGWWAVRRLVKYISISMPLYLFSKLTLYILDLL